MKSVAAADFIDALENGFLIWPPVVVSGSVYALHVDGELWRATA